jgi:hypothetical protein
MSEQKLERLVVPIGRDHGSALIAVENEKPTALVEATYTVFECPLQHGSRVRRIDLEKRARELGCLQDFESVLDHWYRQPRYARPPVLPG